MNFPKRYKTRSLDWREHSPTLWYWRQRHRKQSNQITVRAGIVYFNTLNYTCLRCVWFILFSIARKMANTFRKTINTKIRYVARILQCFQLGTRGQTGANYSYLYDTGKIIYISPLYNLCCPIIRFPFYRKLFLLLLSVRNYWLWELRLDNLGTSSMDTTCAFINNLQGTVRPLWCRALFEALFEHVRFTSGKTEI